MLVIKNISIFTHLFTPILHLKPLQNYFVHCYKQQTYKNSPGFIFGYSFWGTLLASSFLRLRYMVKDRNYTMFGLVFFSPTP